MVPIIPLSEKPCKLVSLDIKSEIIPPPSPKNSFSLPKEPDIASPMADKALETAGISFIFSIQVPIRLIVLPIPEPIFSMTFPTISCSSSQSRRATILSPNIAVKPKKSRLSPSRTEERPLNAYFTTLPLRVPIISIIANKPLKLLFTSSMVSSLILRDFVKSLKLLMALNRPLGLKSKISLKA